VKLEKFRVVKNMRFFYVNLDRCVGCHACEVACRQENSIPMDEWWIKVLETKPEKIGEKTVFYFIPTVNEKCTLCKHLTEKNLNPACVASCPTKALTYSNLTQLTKDILEKKPISILKISQ